MDAKCGTCKYFCDAGDWDLCCDAHERRLCYRDTEACNKYEYSEEKIRQLEEHDKEIMEWIRQQKERRATPQ